MENYIKQEYNREDIFLKETVSRMMGHTNIKTTQIYAIDTESKNRGYL